MGHTCSIESGQRQDPSSKTLQRIAAAFGVTTDSLLSPDADASDAIPPTERAPVDAA